LPDPLMFLFSQLGLREAVAAASEASKEFGAGANPGTGSAPSREAAGRIPPLHALAN
jgi:hypothetical protein